MLLSAIADDLQIDTTDNLESHELERAKQSWRATRERIATAVVRWTETELRPAGDASPFKPGPAAQDRDLHNFELVESIEFAVDYALYLDQDKLRVDLYRRPPNSEWGRQMEPCRQMAAFDGNIYRRLTVATSEGVANQALIHPGRDPGEMRQVALKPLLWAFRVLDPSVCTLRLDEYRDVTKTIGADTAHSVVLEWSDANKRIFLWLDKDRDYSIERYSVERVADGGVTVQLDIDYALHKDVGWLPTRWNTILTRTASQLSVRLNAVVTEMNINPLIDAAEFVLTIPPNTLVVDQTERTEALYLIRKDGIKRQVSEQESFTRTIDEVIATIPGDLSQAQRGSRGQWKWLVAANVVGFALFIVVAAIVCVRKWHKYKEGPLP